VKRIGEQVIAEFVGTMLYVLIGAGSVVLFGLVVNNGDLIGLLPIALAQGLGMAILISNTGHISGGHHNPAVTISIWVAGKIDAVRAALYVVAQLLGAAAGAGLLAVILPKGLWTQTHLGTPQVRTTLGQFATFSPGRAVFLEAVLTFFLVYTVFATAVDDQGSFKSLRGLPIGLAIGVDILVGGFFTGASMNPARSFGPALVSGTWTSFWVYIVGPVTGGILAASLYWFAFLRNRGDFALEDVAATETGGEEAVLETVLASQAESAVDETVLEVAEAELAGDLEAEDADGVEGTKDVSAAPAATDEPAPAPSAQPPPPPPAPAP
jgi:aquaporin TIP